MKDEIEKIKEELDRVSEELYDLKSQKSKSFLQDSHLDLIRDIEDAIKFKITEYRPKEFDDMPVEDFLVFLKTIQDYIKEYKNSYRL